MIARLTLKTRIKSVGITEYSKESYSNLFTITFPTKLLVSQWKREAKCPLTLT